MHPWQPAGAVARGARPQYALGTFGRCYLGILGVLTKVLILGLVPTWVISCGWIVVHHATFFFKIKGSSTRLVECIAREIEH